MADQAITRFFVAKRNVMSVHGGDDGGGGGGGGGAGSGTIDALCSFIDGGEGALRMIDAAMPASRQNSAFSGAPDADADAGKGAGEGASQSAATDALDVEEITQWTKSLERDLDGTGYRVALVGLHRILNLIIRNESGKCCLLACVAEF